MTCVGEREICRDLVRRALYKVMQSPELGRTNKAPMFLSLLFKAMRADVSPKRVCAFVKRLLQVAAHQQPNFACGCLMLTSQLLQACNLPAPELFCTQLCSWFSADQKL